MREKLIDAIEKEKPYIPTSDYEVGYNNGLVMAQSIAIKLDAVEVVRCGACKDWTEIEETGGAGYCNHPCWIIADAEPPIVQFADFCSYGERREGE